MSRTKYQLLPVTDPSPALAVSLSVSGSGAATSGPSSAPMTQINLNSSDSTATTPTNTSNSTPGPVNNTDANSSATAAANNNNTGDIINAPLPPLNELPSYNEAIRLKKLEAYTNDLPPSYFDPAGVEPGEFRSAMDAVNVSSSLFLDHFLTEF
jgi:hypothetical protein